MTIEHLIGIVRQYFPQGRIVETPDANPWPQLVNPPGAPPHDFPREAWPPFGYDETPEHRRLIAARKNAAAQQEPWLRALEEIGARFPDWVVQNNALHLASGSFDSGYSGVLFLSDDGSPRIIRELRFVVSFLAPYYAFSYSTRTYPLGWQPPVLDDNEDLDEQAPDEGGVMYVSGGDLSIPSLPEYLQSFELPADVKPFAQAVEAILRQHFPGYDYLQPEIGTTTLPDVVTDFKFFGEATIYDCIFTNSW